MNEANLPVGCFVRIGKPGLHGIVRRLKQLGYRVIGPTVADSAVVFDEIESASELPVGYVDEQEAATYRLGRDGDSMYFSYTVGPHSLKRFLFPPRVPVLELNRDGDGWEIHEPDPPDRPLAVLGVRSCDLHALAIQDRVFLGDQYVNPDYAARRAGLFVLAVNCGRAAPTCFCQSMGAGPAVTGGFDIALTELPDHFVLEIGTELGGRVASSTPWVPCSTSEVAEARQVPRRLGREMDRRRHAAPGGDGGGRYLDRRGLHEALLENLEHEHWDEVAGRCLACGNCAMVCPTCFCSTVEEVSDLTGDHVRRERAWDCCFSAEHSYMNSGTVRKSIAARYRQWLTHKLATWEDQFGTPGCVGCGRCITWCPVGIDLTAEAAAIRGGAP